MKRLIFNEGDTVFAIVKNTSNFQLEIVSAEVVKINDEEIVLEKTLSPLIANRYVFPRTECGNEIFATFQEAESVFKRI